MEYENNSMAVWRDGEHIWDYNGAWFIALCEHFKKLKVFLPTEMYILLYATGMKLGSPSQITLLLDKTLC